MVSQFYIILLIICSIIIGGSLFLFIKIMKKSNDKTRVKILVSIAVVVCLIVGYFSIDNYISNQWFYNLKSDIESKYDFVQYIKMIRYDWDISFDCFCKNGTTNEDIKPVFESIKKYILSDQGRIESQKSYLKRFFKRGNGVLENIDISFDLNNDNHFEINYHSGYYSDPFRKIVNNFSKWTIN